jgi:hypothetical protein
LSSDFRPHFAATGVGTVPFDDPNQALDLIWRSCSIPYWPQLSATRPAEDMDIQFTEGLPLIRVDLAKRELRLDEQADRAGALAEFYEKVLAGAADEFAISPEFGAGLQAFLRRLEIDPPASGWVKGQVVGPFTLASAVRDASGKAIVHDSELLEAAAQGLAMKAIWQVRKFAGLGLESIVFFDEPILSGFGSAFSALQRDQVIRVLSDMFEAVRAQVEVLIGVHCCGNTAWSMLVETGLDIINIDSHGYGQSLLLYPKALADLYARGGLVAWGAIPTLNYTGDETAAGLWDGLREILDGVAGQGVDQTQVSDQALITPACSLIAAHSLITPACGMATRTGPAAEHIHRLLVEVADLARQWS